jgi:dienelactone hydrolase
MQNKITVTRRSALALLPPVALPLGAIQHSHLPEQSPAASDDSAARPAVGNLYPVLDGYAREVTPSLSFDPSRWPKLEDWKREARGKCLDRLSYHPPVIPFEASTKERRPRRGYVQEEIVFRSSPGVEVPGSLLIPQGSKQKYPALVALHDHGGYYHVGREKLLEREKSPAILDAFCQTLYEGVPYAAELARLGYVVLVTDAFYFGDRRFREDTVPENAETRALSKLPASSDEYIRAYNKWANVNEALTARTIFLAGATWPGIIGWDDRRSVDYLLTRPEVDATRIGCLGLSMGGFRAAYLAGLHSAVRSSVVTCWMSAFEPMLAHHAGRHTWMIHAPGLYQYLDLPDVASMTAPNALLVQYGWKDVLFPNEGKELSATKLKTAYEKAGVSNQFRASFYDQPHMFSKQMQHEAIEWFGKTLS